MTGRGAKRRRVRASGSFARLPGRGRAQALRALAWALFLAFLPASLCGPDPNKPCFSSLRPGVYRVDVLERYDRNSKLVMPSDYTHTNPCPDDFDLRAGMSFTIETNGRDYSSWCWAYSATVIELGETVYRDSDLPGVTVPGMNIRGVLSAGDGCSGSWEATLTPRGDETPSPDRPPPWVLTRSFLAGSSGSPVGTDAGAEACGQADAYCIDQYAVQVHHVR